MYRGAPRGRPFPQQRGAPRGYAPQAVASTAEAPNAEMLALRGKFTFSQVNRQVADVARRYSRSLPMDLVRMQCFYAEQPNLPISLNVPMDFHLKTPATTTQVEAATTAGVEAKGITTRHFVRVMLLSGCKEEEDKSKAKIHLVKRLNFLLARKENGSGMFAVGGEWSAEKDGATPTDAAMKKTALRHAKDIMGLDLSKCTKWTKFVEFNYNRSDNERSRTVVFLPNVWDHFPDGLEPCIQIKVENKEVTEMVDEEVEDEEDSTKKTTVKKEVTSTKEIKTNISRPFEMSLHSLLESDCRPCTEDSMEISLFADCFDEMLQRDFGLKVLDILKNKMSAAEAEKENVKKRKREEEEAVEAKKQKTEEEQKEDEKKEADKKEAEANKPKTKIQHTVDQEMLLPFQFFDKQPPAGNVAGHLKREVLEAVLHQLGSLTKHDVDEYLAAINMGKTAYNRSPILYYIKLATTSVEVPWEEEEEKKPEEKKEEAKEEEKAEEKKEEAKPMEEDEAPTEESLKKLLLKDLRAMCTAKDLPSTGTKQVLIEALLK